MAALLDTVLNPALGWLFRIPPVLAILFMSCVLALLGTLIQKWMTDQAKLRRLREDVKKGQKRYKDLIKTDPQKAIKAQQDLFPAQREMMAEGLKPMLVTMIPFLLIAAWMGSHFAYEPILPGQPFTVTASFAEGVAGDATLTVPKEVTIDNETKPIADGKASWALSAPEGDYKIALTAANGIVNDSRDVVVSTQRLYATPIIKKQGIVTGFDVSNRKLTPLGPVSLFGWMPGWIACYILFSIPISLLLRKALNVA